MNECNAGFVQIIRGDEFIEYSVEPIHRAVKIADTPADVCHLELLEEMDIHQLRHLTSILIQKCQELNRQIEFMNTDKGIETTLDARKMMRLVEEAMLCKSDSPGPEKG